MKVKICVTQRYIQLGIITASLKLFAEKTVKQSSFSIVITQKHPLFPPPDRKITLKI